MEDRGGVGNVEIDNRKADGLSMSYSDLLLEASRNSQGGVCVGGLVQVKLRLLLT